MKTLIIAAILVGILVIAIAGITIVKAATNTSTQDGKPTCTSCGCNGGCTAEKNCGMASCGAVNGGTCSCAKK